MISIYSNLIVISHFLGKNLKVGMSTQDINDMCHAYRPGSDWVSQHALSINNKRRNIGKNDLLQVAKQMNVKKAEKVISEISGVIRNWESYAAKVNVEQPLKEAIAKTVLTLG
jgi:serine/threonine-protein kinase HipA